MTDILNPQQEVQTARGPVTVRELAWPQAMEFFQRLSEAVGRLIDESGQFRLTPERLVQIVSGSRQLSEWLLLAATGRDQDQEWLETLRPPDALALLDAAIALNLSEELIARGKKLAERVQGAFGLDGLATAPAPNNSRESSISSSPRVTASPNAAP